MFIQDRAGIGAKLRRDSGLVTCKATVSRISCAGNLPQPRWLGPTMWGKKIGKDSKTTHMLWRVPVGSRCQGALKGERESEVPPAGPDVSRLHRSL